ncbi:MAG TPA: hypothetical protein VNH13_06920 [Candidatus Acidoferrales bacterium]|nr:hypothetical protein [Candidatus Acidoferrales bacterium]
MSKRPRWIALLALVVGAGGLVAVTRLLPAADAGRAGVPSGLSACAARPETGPGAAAAPGSFFKLQPALDANGVLAGQRLFVGRGGVITGSATLAAESAASGPVGGVVAVTEDDGTQSTVKLVAAGTGCASVVHTSASVIRRAIIDPVDGSLLFHLVDRASRADLGIWRLAAPGGAPLRVVEPLPAGLVEGPVWATDLRLDQAGRFLAVQSCVDRACVTRLVDLAAPGSPPALLRGKSQGPLLGFAGGRLVTWAACDGLPCGLLSWDPASGSATQLVGDAVAAGLTAGGRLVVIVSRQGADRAVAVDPTSGAVEGLRGLAAGERPLLAGGLGSVGLEVGPDELAVAQPAGNPRAYRPTPAGEVIP